MIKLVASARQVRKDGNILPVAKCWEDTGGSYKLITPDYLLLIDPFSSVNNGNGKDLISFINKQYCKGKAEVLLAPHNKVLFVRSGYSDRPNPSAEWLAVLHVLES